MAKMRFALHVIGLCIQLSFVYSRQELGIEKDDLLGQWRTQDRQQHIEQMLLELLADKRESNERFALLQEQVGILKEQNSKIENTLKETQKQVP